MNYIDILIAVIAYLIGSVPTALIVVRKATGIDIRKNGSGNVGAMNSYDVTKKKWVGIVVMLLDALKGVLAVLIAKFIGAGFPSLAAAAIFAVLGHNFSVFIRFRGGRGLATAAGAVMIINPLVIAFWFLMYVAGWFIIKKNVHIANLTATVCAPLMIYYTPQVLLDKTSLSGKVPVTGLMIAVAITAVIIIIRHIKPLTEMMKNSDSFNRIQK